MSPPRERVPGPSLPPPPPPGGGGGGGAPPPPPWPPLHVSSWLRGVRSSQARPGPPASPAAEPRLLKGTQGVRWPGVRGRPSLDSRWGGCWPSPPSPDLSWPHGREEAGPWRRRPSQDLPPLQTPRARCSTVSSSPWQTGDSTGLTYNGIDGQHIPSPVPPGSSPRKCQPGGRGFRNICCLPRPPGPLLGPWEETIQVACTGPPLVAWAGARLPAPRGDGPLGVSQGVARTRVFSDPQLSGQEEPLHTHLRFFSCQKTFFFLFRATPAAHGGFQARG